MPRCFFRVSGTLVDAFCDESSSWKDKRATVPSLLLLTWRVELSLKRKSFRFFASSLHQRANRNGSNILNFFSRRLGLEIALNLGPYGPSDDALTERSFAWPIRPALSRTAVKRSDHCRNNHSQGSRLLDD